MYLRLCKNKPIVASWYREHLLNMQESLVELNYLEFFSFFLESTMA